MVTSDRKASGRYPGVLTIKGKKYIRYYVGQDEVMERVPVETDKAAAELRQELLVQVAKGEWKPRAERNPRPHKVDHGPTFDRLLKLHESDWIPTRKRKKWHEDMVAILRQKFGARLLAEMCTPVPWEGWRDELLRRRLAVQTVRTYLIYASGVFNRALESVSGRALVTANPLVQVRLPDRRKGLKRSLSIEQAEALLAWCAQHDELMYRWVALVLKTGMRVEEARDLRWEQVDLPRARLALEVVKNDEPRWVAIPAALLSQMKAWKLRAGATKAVIGKKLTSIPYERWRAAFAGAGIPWGGSGLGKYTSRNLRTSFSMLTLQAGADKAWLAEQAGHTQQTMDDYYAEASHEQRVAVVEANPVALPEPART